MGTKQNPGPFDCYGKAGDDEPIFVLRSTDPQAIRVITYWIGLSRSSQPTEKIHEAANCAQAMKAWRTEHGLPTHSTLEMRDFV